MILLQLAVDGLLLGAVYALFSSGLTLIWGMMNVVNFAHGDFLTIGAYAAFFVNVVLGLNLLIAALGAIVAVVLWGVVTAATTRLGDASVHAAGEQRARRARQQPQLVAGLLAGEPKSARQPRTGGRRCGWLRHVTAPSWDRVPGRPGAAAGGPAPLRGRLS